MIRVCAIREHLLTDSANNNPGGKCDANWQNDCEPDCLGNFGGNATEDACDICGGDNSTCLDCAGTPYGMAYKDDCGTCNANYDDDCVSDCADLGANIQGVPCSQRY